MKKLKTHITKVGVFGLLLYIFISCYSSSREEYYKKFDMPLIRESDKYRLSGDYKGYIKLIDEYYRKASKMGYEDGKGLCHLQMFQINELTMNYKKSLYFLNRADSILKKSSDPVHKALLYNAHLSNNYKLGIFDTSLYYSNKALASLDQVKDKKIRERFQAPAYVRRAALLAARKEFDSSTSYLYRAQKIKNDFLTEGAFSALYADQNNIDSLAVHIKKAEVLLRNSKDISPTENLSYHLLLGYYYSKLRQNDKAEAEFSKLLDLKRKIQNTFSIQMNLYQILAMSYKDMGNTEKATYYMKLYAIEKQKQEKEIQSVIDPAVSKFIADVNEIDVQDRRRMWVFISLLGILCIIVAIFAYRQLTTLKRNKKQLNDQAETLKERIGDQKYDEMIALAKVNDPAFLDKFREIYPCFMQKLQKLNPELENSELAFAALIKLNFSAKEIASYTFIQHESVQQRKRRLRKKLNISSDVDLYKFFSML